MYEQYKYNNFAVHQDQTLVKLILTYYSDYSKHPFRFNYVTFPSYCNAKKMIYFAKSLTV